MRMWLVPTELMCRQHLLGEHVEMHMFAGSLRLGQSVNGYLDGLVDPKQLVARHDEIVVEMDERGYNHRSPLESPQAEHYKGHVDPYANRKELRRRCTTCRKKGM